MMNSTLHVSISGCSGAPVESGNSARPASRAAALYVCSRAIAATAAAVYSLVRSVLRLWHVISISLFVVHVGFVVGSYRRVKQRKGQRNSQTARARFAGSVAVSGQLEMVVYY